MSHISISVIHTRLQCIYTAENPAEIRSLVDFHTNSLEFELVSILLTSKITGMYYLLGVVVSLKLYLVNRMLTFLATGYEEEGKCKIKLGVLHKISFHKPCAAEKDLSLEPQENQHNFCNYRIQKGIDVYKFG